MGKRWPYTFRLSQGFFQRHSVPVHPSPHSFVMESVLHSEISECYAFALVFNHYCIAPVSVLLKGCRPSAIFGRITHFVINPIKRMTGWASTHIGKEGLVRVAPSIAHAYPSAAVKVVLAILSVIASGNGMSPRVCTLVCVVCPVSSILFYNKKRFTRTAYKLLLYSKKCTTNT